MTNKIGVDLGFANITVSDVTSGVSREESIALLDKNTNRILSLGNDAYTYTGEGAESGVLVRPFKNGMLYSQDLTSAILRNTFSAVKTGDYLRAIIGIPSGFLPRQEKELFSICKDAGADEVFGVNRAIAAMIGAGYSPAMSCISVNIGAGATEVAVLRAGEILSTTRSQVGGEDFDQAVKQYILDQGDVGISLSVARAIKEKLCAVWPGHDNEELAIEGTLSLTGNRITMKVCTEDFLGVFEKPMSDLLMAIAEPVKRIPPEAVEEIFSNGIVLTGGMSELWGLDKMIAKVLDIPVTVAQNPADCVAKGLSRITTFIPERMRINERNITSSLFKYYETKKNKSKTES